MIARLRNSWSLFRRSLRVLKSHPKLLVIPAFNTLFTLGILVFYLAVPLLQPTGHPLSSVEHWAEVGRRAVRVDEEARTALLAELDAGSEESMGALEAAATSLREQDVAGNDAAPEAPGAAAAEETGEPVAVRVSAEESAATEAGARVEPGAPPAESAGPTGSGPEQGEAVAAGGASGSAGGEGTTTSPQEEPFGWLASAESLRLRGWTISWIVGFYLLSVFLATFLSTALYHEVMRAFEGDRVSLFRGLGFATSRIPQLVGWTLLVGAIGLIVKVIEERLPYVGRMTAALFGTAFHVAAVFAVPVLVMEERTGNPFGVLKKSVRTLKETWGEALAGYVGIRVVGSVLLFGLVPLAMLLVAAPFVVPGQATNVILLFAWLALGGAAFMVAYLQRLTNAVYRCALYRYARTRELPEGFDEASMSAGWRTR